MKIVYNKNDEKEIKSLMGFEFAQKGKRIDFLLAATLSTELSKRQQIVFKPIPDLNMPPNFFYFNVNKQANVLILVNNINQALINLRHHLFIFTFPLRVLN